MNYSFVRSGGAPALLRKHGYTLGMHVHARKLLLFVLVTMFATVALAHRAPTVTTVILVRHGEKSAPSGDVPLSEAGTERANELVRVLTGVKIDAIYTTPYIRTRATAAPIAQQRGIEPVEVATANYSADMVRLIQKKHKGQTVLVVGHSDTTPKLIADLRGSVAEIKDSTYDNLFIVTLVDGALPKVLELRYGADKR